MKFLTSLFAVSLFALPVQFGWADPAATPAPVTAAASAASDRLARANAEKEKGDLARAHKNYEYAATHYAAALRLDNQNSELYDKLGIVEIKLNEMKAARKHFNQALKLNPIDTVALNNLGVVAYLSRKFKPAIGYFKQALALNETTAATHLNLAEAWIGLGEFDRAMTEYARALELDADLINNNAEGVQARIRTPEQRARTSYLLAKAYAKRGNLESALEFLRRAKDDHYPELARVYSDQEFAPLWKDPRLAKIVKR